MRRRRFLFIEPSKVGSQHITLIEGYLRALLASEQLSRSFELSFLAADSTFAALSSAVRGAVRHIRIPVMNPEKRRLVRKTCVECYVVLRCLLRMRRGDVLFVSCVLPTTLLVLEACNRVLRRRGLFVELHGEIEGLFDRSMQGVRSFGFWVLQWMRLRRRGSLLSLVVIDDFIKSRLLQEYPGKLSVADIFVVHIPVSPLALAPMPAAEHAPGDGPGAHAPATVCFIGYRGRLKGFDQFMQLSESAAARWRMCDLPTVRPSSAATPICRQSPAARWRCFPTWRATTAHCPRRPWTHSRRGYASSPRSVRAS
jgi:hypothetical protein